MGEINPRIGGTSTNSGVPGFVIDDTSPAIPTLEFFPPSLVAQGRLWGH